jgi:hypothetical protein
MMDWLGATPSWWQVIVFVFCFVWFDNMSKAAGKRYRERHLPHVYERRALARQLREYGRSLR